MFLRLNVLALTLLLAALLRIKAEVTCLKSSWIHNCRMRTFQFQYVSIYLHLKRFERPRQVLRRLVQDPQLDAPEIQPHCCCRQDARLREESFCTSSSFFFFFLLLLFSSSSSCAAEIVIGTSTGTCKFKSLGKCCRSRNFPKCASEGGRRKFFGFKCQEQLQVGGRQEVLRTGAGHDVFASWVAEPFKDS